MRFDTERMEQEALRAEAQCLLAAASQPGTRAWNSGGLRR
jgi:hypothetical protein